MIKNYFKIAWRNLFRNKGFSITNLLGLTIGITCTVFIFLWVKDELTYDKFHSNYQNVYKVMANRNFNNQIFTDPSMVLPLAKELESRSPLVKKAVVTTYPGPHVLAIGEVKLNKNGQNVSEHYFDVFSWRFLKGNALTAINDPSSIVLTESTAKALFGDEDPLNKVVRIDDNNNAKVTAVIADVPANSTLQFDYLLPFNYSDSYIKQAMNEWVNSSWNVFVLTNPDVNLQLLDKSINDIKKEHDKNDAISTYFTFPMNKWRLYSDFKDGKNTGGMIEYVRLFTVIAIIILLIACINFMNLSTARSEKRAKEVGIRKTLGSNKMQLRIQFFFESVVLTLIAFIFSIAAVYLLMPSFNLMVGKQLSLNLIDPIFWIGAIVIILFTGFVAGSYPALYLSSFNPIKVLKGTFLAGKNAVMPRRILVVMQFVISILFISSTIIVYRQIKHIKNRDLGYNPDNLIMVPSSQATDKNFAVIKEELVKTGLISSVTRTSSPITEIWWNSPAPDYSGKPAKSNIIFTGMSTDIDFAKTVGVEIIEGRDFSGTPSDSSNMLLNKVAVETMGLKNPIGMQMRYAGRNYTVIGVTDNIIISSPFKPVDPMMIYYSSNNSNTLCLRVNEGIAPQKALQSIEAIFKKYNPAFPFEYKFVDQEFGKKFLKEELISKITNLFAGLAIFICCIGLAGLASFTIEKRLREISIRKVLGSSVEQLLMLISKEFLKLVMVAFIIAVPLSWWLMYNWLQQYDSYKINISFWVFGIVGVLILLLTMLIVSLNTLKAALANPVKSLRTE
jgi:ABC-type antimicrobial peptide transport system permease subunit